MASKVVTVTLDDEVLANLDDFAKELGLTRSSTVNMLLKASLTQDMGDVFREMFKSAMTSKSRARKRKTKTVTA